MKMLQKTSLSILQSKLPENTKNTVRLEPKILRNPEITLSSQRNPKEPKKLKGTIKSPEKPLGDLI